MKQKAIAIGTDNFKKLIEKDCYYIDKTLLIKELLDKKSEVTLFTRPRRFGKTLNQKMIQCFFEDTGNEEINAENKKLFEGLKIMDAGEEYTKHMQKYPVIFLSLKSAKQDSFEMAFKMLKDEIIDEFRRHKKIVVPALEDDNILKKYNLIESNVAKNEEYFSAVKFLSGCLKNAYGKNAIILIDEYDVPLESAYYNGFYDKMINFIRSLFESALKTNLYLEFAVITGCLRISKESVFTGLNNPSMVSILDKRYDEYFGFTQAEVEAMAEYYGHLGRMNDIRYWYDGYVFGSAEVYNPWSVINFMADLNADKDQRPKPYWANTSSNAIVKDLIEQADDEAKDELETLMKGGTIIKPVHEDITYGEVNESQDNLWNFLFFTGYLKKVLEVWEYQKLNIELAIPNTELLLIYESHIKNWFNKKVKQKDLTGFYQAFLEGDVSVFEEGLSDMLMESISYLDSPEAFYHGFLLGILSGINGGYLAKSNRESGNGRYDVCIYNKSRRKPAYVLEFKVAKEFRQIDDTAAKALFQIEDKKYDADLRTEGYSVIYHYGIGFCGKDCAVKVKKVEIE